MYNHIYNCNFNFKISIIKERKIYKSFNVSIATRNRCQVQSPKIFSSYIIYIIDTLSI